MSASCPRPRVLLVDDDDLLRRTFARVLAVRFDVTEASDGRRAVELLGAETFDAVVTDLEMPFVGGDGVAAWLATNQPALAERLIVVTGGAKHVAQVEWLRTVEPGRLLRKPCAASDLVSAVEAVLRGGAP